MVIFFINRKKQKQKQNKKRMKIYKELNTMLSLHSKNLNKD